MAYSPEAKACFEAIQAFITRIENTLDLQATKNSLLADRSEQHSLMSIASTLLHDRRKRLTKSSAGKTSSRYTKLRNNLDLQSRNMKLIGKAIEEIKKELNSLDEQIILDPAESPDEIFDDYQDNDFKLTDAYTDNDLQIISYMSLRELKTQLKQVKRFYDESKSTMPLKNPFKAIQHRSPRFFRSARRLFANDNDESPGPTPGA